MTVWRNAIIAAAVLALLVLAGLAFGMYQAAELQSESDTLVRLTYISTAAGVAGLAISVAAVAFALAAFWTGHEQYKEWRTERLRKPNIEIALCLGPDDGISTPSRIEGSEATVRFAGSSVVLRLEVTNRGEGTVFTGNLNLVVGSGVMIEPMDPPPKGHYLVPFTADDGLLGGPVHFTAVNQDFPPNDYMFHARLLNPECVSSYKVRANLLGRNPDGSKFEKWAGPWTLKR